MDHEVKSRQSWFPIMTAVREPGREILGSIWAKGADGRMVCTKEPFVSFWSPSLNKFYCNPTHWLHMPEPPDDPEIALAK